MKRTKKVARHRWARRLAWCGAVVLAAALAVVGWIWWLAGDRYQGDEPTRLYLPTGSSAQAVADTLRSALGEDYGSKVARLWGWQGGKEAAGSYVVEPGATSLSTSRRLLRGHQSPVRVTFNNVRTLPQLAERVARGLEITDADFLAGCDSVLPAAGFKPQEYVAAFLPDTYEFYWNATPEAVVKRLLDVRNRFWEGERRDAARALGLTPAQVATLASIVEEETAKADERPLVARLYLNRLGRGMLLQADPTVKYAVGDFSLRRILGKHLAADSPYNTYKYAGLPPGPIRVAAREAIDAVLNAPAHGYLYMCAKEDFSGYHNFAADYATHMANARRYQAELNRRGIR